MQCPCVPCLLHCGDSTVVHSDRRVYHPVRWFGLGLHLCRPGENKATVRFIADRGHQTFITKCTTHSVAGTATHRQPAAPVSSTDKVRKALGTSRKEKTILSSLCSDWRRNASDHTALYSPRQNHMAFHGGCWILPFPVPHMTPKFPPLPGTPTAFAGSLLCSVGPGLAPFLQPITGESATTRTVVEPPARTCTSTGAPPLRDNGILYREGCSN